MNTSNKEDTMATMGGANQRISSCFHNVFSRNMERMKPFTDEISSKRCEIVDSQRVITHGQRNSHLDANKVKSPESREKLMYSIFDSRNRSSDIKQNLLNSKLLDSDQNHSIEENLTLQGSPIKLSHRKKLYVCGDSPVDLVCMKSSIKNTIPKSKLFSHPALELLHERQTKYIFNRGEENSLQKYHTRILSSSSSSSGSSFNIPNFSNHERLRNSLNYFNEILPDLNIPKKQERSHSSIDTNNNFTKHNNQNVDKSANTIITNKNEFSNSVKSSSSDVRRNLTKKKPVFSLESDTKKFYGSKMAMMSLQNLNPVVCLKRLSMFDVQQLKNSKNTIINPKNLNPIVCLKGLSELDILKYRRQTQMSTIPRNLNPVVSLTPLLIETNNNKLDYKQNINNALRVPISSCHHSHDISHSEKLEAVYHNMVEDTDKDTNKRMKRKSDRILFCDDDDDENDEFVKLIPKRRHQSFDSSVYAHLNDTHLSNKARKDELRCRSKPICYEYTVQSTTPKSAYSISKGWRKSKRILQYQSLMFRTRIIDSDSDSDSEVSSLL